jgi:multidrug transporter EmrE-like cation transporter
MINWIPYFFIGAIVSIEALGDYYLAEFAINGLASGVLIGYLSYAIVLVLFVSSIRTMGLAWSNSAWDGWSNIATNLVAVYGLGEKPSVTQYIGMSLISIGIILLGNKSTRKITA